MTTMMIPLCLMLVTPLHCSGAITKHREITMQKYAQEQREYIGKKITMQLNPVNDSISPYMERILSS